MSEHIQLLLPWPPSVNHYWRANGNRRFISKEGMNFRATVSDICAEQGVKTLYGRLAVHVAVFPPDRRVRDLDNLGKAIFDSLEHAGCYDSDGQIDEIHIFRKQVQPGGACTVLIIEINP